MVGQGLMRGGYCVARPEQLAGVATFEDLLTRLGRACVLVLEGALIDHDPVTELAQLVAILMGEPNGKTPIVAIPPSTERGDLALAKTSMNALLALQGADGDPELEWDDVATLWRRSGGLLGESTDLEDHIDEELLVLIDQLRHLALLVGADAALYCWRSTVQPRKSLSIGSVAVI